VDGCDCEQTLKLIAEGKLYTEPLNMHPHPLMKIDEAYGLFENLGRKENVMEDKKEIQEKAISFRKLYWNYYKQIENDFFSYVPYCELDKQNDNSFSMRYLQLILSICGEIDTIFKTFCYSIKSDFDTEKSGIDDYIDIITNCFPTFATETVNLLNYQYRTISPWKAVQYNQIPNWWSSYNKLKHHRDKVENSRENYKMATQKNTIEALSALYILVEYWTAYTFIINNGGSIEKENAIMPFFKSKEFYMPEWKFYYCFMGPQEWFDTTLFLEYIKCAKILN